MKAEARGGASDGAVVLALDQGGHSSRAAVYDASGELIAQSQVAVGVRAQGDDRVEQDPEELVDSLKTAMTEVAAALGGRRPAAAGLATQRASICCWDRVTGEALTPVISWQDRRAAALLDRYRARADSVRRLTGLRLSPHYGASKIKWCLDHLPEVGAAAERRRLACGPLASFLVARLTREHLALADPANASRTLLYDIDRAEWSPELLSLFEIDTALLPACTPTRFAFGRLRAYEDLPLTIVTGDQAAALYALGQPRADAVYVNLGTGAFAQRPLAGRERVDAGLLQSVVYQDDERSERVIEGTVNGAGAALDWAQEHLALEDLVGRLANWMDDAQEAPIFLNGIGGLGAPYWRPAFSSRFIGEGDAAGKSVAVADSVVFLLAVIIERMGATGAAPKHLYAGGGLARLDALCRRLAAVTGLSVNRPADHEATARGLAFLVAGRPASWRMPACKRFEARSDARLSRRYRRWREEMDRALSA